MWAKGITVFVRTRAIRDAHCALLCLVRLYECKIDAGKRKNGALYIQDLYESRIASLQRFVAMTVKSVYKCIATTASPVNSANVQQRMRHMLPHKREIITR